MPIMACLVVADGTRDYELRLQGSYAATRQHMIDMKDMKFNRMSILSACKVSASQEMLELLVCLVAFLPNVSASTPG
jgi:hypothetical protein